MLNFCEFFALRLDFQFFFLNQKNPHRVKFLRSLTVTLEQGISFKEGVKTFYILISGTSKVPSIGEFHLNLATLAKFFGILPIGLIKVYQIW